MQASNNISFIAIELIFLNNCFPVIFGVVILLFSAFHFLDEIKRIVMSLATFPIDNDALGNKRNVMKDLYA